MTIQDAIKSGKPFKRKLWGYGWYEAVHPKLLGTLYVPEMIGYETTQPFCVADLLAEDWETIDLEVKP